MDITVDVGNYKLNVRAAAIIIHNNKVLVHKNKKSDHYSLIGGRVQIGENSMEAVKREIKEELGKEIEITGYISTVENFFKMKGSEFHEIMFVYKADFLNKDDKKIENIMKNIEGKEYLQYEWLDLKNINQYSLKPQIMKKVLKNNVFPVHEINND